LPEINLAHQPNTVISFSFTNQMKTDILIDVIVFKFNNGIGICVLNVPRMSRPHLLLLPARHWRTGGSHRVFEVDGSNGWHALRVAYVRHKYDVSAKSAERP